MTILNIFPYFCMSILNDMIQIIQLKGKDKHLYRLLAPMVMDPEVIRANNNYPFKNKRRVCVVHCAERKGSGGIHSGGAEEPEESCNQ